MIPMLAIPFPMIDPVAVALGPIVIRWYATMPTRVGLSSSLPGGTIGLATPT